MRYLDIAKRAEARLKESRSSASALPDQTGHTELENAGREKSERSEGSVVASSPPPASGRLGVPGRMTPQQVLELLFAGGGRLVAEATNPHWMVPADLEPFLQAHRGLLHAAIDLKEVVRRTTIFREQIESWAKAGRVGVPTVTLPEAPTPAVGDCVACGSRLNHGHWRCPTCTAALYAALTLRPTEPEAA